MADSKSPASRRGSVRDVLDSSVAAQTLRARCPECRLWGHNLREEGIGSDIILQKFLRARENDVDKAAAMLERTILWRRANVEGQVVRRVAPSSGLTLIGPDLEGRPTVLARLGSEDAEAVFGDPHRFVKVTILSH